MWIRFPSTLSRGTSKGQVSTRLIGKLKWQSVVNVVLALIGLTLMSESIVAAEPTHHTGSEASLVLPDLNSVKFLFGPVGGRDLLWLGLVVSIAGILFGLVVS
ncbi:MAG: sodium-translocating pyrophosphatase, partial [Schlesneria sp.]